MPIVRMIVEIDIEELAVRLVEAYHEIERPHPDACESLLALGKEIGMPWLRAACVAADYMEEITSNAKAAH